MSDYKPGSMVLVPVKGAAGYWIGIAEALAHDPSRYSHAALLLDEAGTIIEAEPGGARLANISEYAGQDLLISDGPVQMWLGTIPRPDERAALVHDEKWIRARIVEEALKFQGVAYSGLDYLALAALHLHLPSKRLREYVKSTGHVICSQLVDAAFLNAGIHLFQDGRLPGDVCPADLANWIEDWEAVQ